MLLVKRWHAGFVITLSGHKHAPGPCTPLLSSAAKGTHPLQLGLALVPGAGEGRGALLPGGLGVVRGRGARGWGARQLWPAGDDACHQGRLGRHGVGLRRAAHAMLSDLVLACSRQHKHSAARAGTSLFRTSTLGTTPCSSSRATSSNILECVQVQVLG